MTLDKEIKIWLERRKMEVVSEIDNLQGELDFINDRLEGRIVSKAPRQYYALPGQFTMVHGSNLTPPYYEFICEYQKFLKGDQV